MFIRKNRVEKNGKVYEHAYIVRSERDEDGQPTHEVLKSLGRMETEEDWEWAESVLGAMEREEEEVPEAKGLEIKEQLELDEIGVAEELWKGCGIQEALLESIEDRKPEFKFERFAPLLAMNRLFEPSSDLSAHQWINERMYPPRRSSISGSIDLWICWRGGGQDREKPFRKPRGIA